MPIALCLSTTPAQLQRWQVAFPDGRIVPSVAKAEPFLTEPGIVWLHLDSLLRPLPTIINDLYTKSPALSLIGMSNAPHPGQGLEFLRHGGRGYCHALAAPVLLQRVATVVQSGGVWAGVDVMQHLTSILPELVASKPVAEGSELERLSQRERQVAEMVAGGASNKEIASNLKITERTVKAHLSAIFSKLNLRDRLQLALLAIRQEQT